MGSSAIVRSLIFPFLKWFRKQPPLLRRLRGEARAELVSFNHLFPEAEKFGRIEPHTVPTPEVQHIPLEPDGVHVYGETYTIPEDYVAKLEDVYYTPTNNVVCTSSGKIISESANAASLGCFFLRDLYTRDMETIPGYCTPWRTRYHNYFHVLLECIPRLLALESTRFREVEEIKLLTPEGLSDTEQFYLSTSVRLDNLRVELLDRRKLYRTESLLFTPLKVRCGTGYLPQMYWERMRTRLTPERPSRRNNRIYISRIGPVGAAHGRAVENESELIAALDPLGFQKVRLETLSPRSQVELFYDAEVVVGPHGAGFTNLLFSHQVAVIELFPTWYIWPHYYYLCKSMGHNYKYWNSNGDRIHAEKFRVDVPAVMELLAELGVS